ncbi:MAG: hypothetical protein U5L96_04755 [Owenweeksia sp.]|nr:hypothetical protein [Owenweeksia sp.]
MAPISDLEVELDDGSGFTSQLTITGQQQTSECCCMAGRFNKFE